MSDAGDRGGPLDAVSAHPVVAASAADVQQLLVETSRTFAVSIPLLEEPTRLQVGVAYLLFRIADTFEDAAAWPRSRRIEALEQFAALVEGGRTDDAELAERWLVDPPTSHAGYLDLLRRAPEVLAAARALPGDSWEVVRRHTLRTCDGMRRFARRADGDGVLQLATLGDLRAYCYVVAGIVGELLTDLFVLAEPQLEAGRGELDRRAARFGEALQLVNILKDSADDAREGRTFLPPRAARAEVMALARADLEVAREYVELLRTAGAPAGQVAFTALPLRLARDTLDLVERHGAGAKIERAVVERHLREVLEATARGTPAC